MIFKHLKIINFRNFKNVDIDLTNRNIVFGLNDIGKSNFLAALRFLLDRDFRKDGFIESDFYNKNTDREIEITLSIDITDEEDDLDSKKIITMMKGAIDSQAHSVIFQLKSTFDREKSIGEPNLFWGTDINELEDIPSRQSYFELDRFFNVVYIDSSIKLENVFRKYSREILRKESSMSEEEREKLEDRINELNDFVGELQTIQSFERELVEEYKKFNDERDFDVKIQSEIEIGNLHSKLTPYILAENRDTFPTAGDGRKKILAYTLLTLENRRKEEVLINVFLIEEIENHLHRAMQLALSREIFTDKLFKYLFLTTHSSLIVSQMDDVNLIKLMKENTVVGKAHPYKVPEEYRQLKQKLNQNLAEAIYADVVLLVEGPSERILFERILNEICPKYESVGGYILQVDGINFSEYVHVLRDLGIESIVRTDNDLKFIESRDELNLLGINRCLSLIDKAGIANLPVDDVEKYKKDYNYRRNVKRKIYENNEAIISELKNSKIFISKIDLENDLYEAIGDVMDNFASEQGSSKGGVDYLQEAKMMNMIALCKHMDKVDVERIYNHENFECLKELVNLCCR